MCICAYLFVYALCLLFYSYSTYMVNKDEYAYQELQLTRTTLPGGYRRP